MKSLAELEVLREQAKNQLGIRSDDAAKIKIVVGMATCGIAAGARPVLSAFGQSISDNNLLDVAVYPTGCIGLCKYEPVVEVLEDGKDKVTYGNVTPEKAAKIISDHIIGGKPVAEFMIGAK